MNHKDLIIKIQKRFKQRMNVSTKELHSYIKQIQPHFPDKTISWKIYLLKESGEVNHIGRGVYSFSNKPSFNPSISNTSKNIFIRIKKTFPYLNLCIWETSWLNSFMKHQIGRFYTVIETEKDGVDSVFHLISETKKNVFVNPDKQMLERYIGNFNESIIVKPLISEAPTNRLGGITTASIEKILVDCLSDTVLLSAQQGELDNIFSVAFEKYNVNINKSKRYARRRDRLKEFEKMLTLHYKTSAK